MDVFIRKNADNASSNSMDYSLVVFAYVSIQNFLNRRSVKV